MDRNTSLCPVAIGCDSTGGTNDSAREHIERFVDREAIDEFQMFDCHTSLEMENVLPSCAGFAEPAYHIALKVGHKDSAVLCFRIPDCDTFELNESPGPTAVTVIVVALPMIGRAPRLMGFFSGSRDEYETGKNTSSVQTHPLRNSFRCGEVCFALQSHSCGVFAHTGDSGAACAIDCAACATDFVEDHDKDHDLVKCGVCELCGGQGPHANHCLDCDKTGVLCLWLIAQSWPWQCTEHCTLFIVSAS
jgi:hypothetical protein